METEKPTYSYSEAYEASLAYFNGDELAARVWVSKYALKDSGHNIYELTPADMHHRIAGEIARIEAKYPNPMSHEEVFELLDRFRYVVPQGSPMAGIGNNLQVGSLSNCFVIGLDGHPDSYGGIILSYSSGSASRRRPMKGLFSSRLASYTSNGPRSSAMSTEAR